MLPVISTNKVLFKQSVHITDKLLSVNQNSGFRLDAE